MDKLLDVYECKPTPTTTSSASVTTESSDPSSDPDPDIYPRDIDADLELEAANLAARDIKLRRGGLLRKQQAGKVAKVAKRDLGIRQLFGQ